MTKKRHTPEQIVTLLRQVDVTVGNAAKESREVPKGDGFECGGTSRFATSLYLTL